MRKLIFILTGLISFIYWIWPMVQDSIYQNYLDRTYDFGGVLYLSVMLFQGVNMISPALSYITQLLMFLITWFILYKAIIFFRR